MRPRLTLLVAALLATTGSAAWSAPPPRVRELPAGIPTAARLARSEHASSVADVCGTRVESVTEMVALHQARIASVQTLPTPNTTDVGEIAVLEDDSTIFFHDKGDKLNVDLASAARVFYRTHGDDYDCLAFYLASGLDSWLGSPTALASATVIRNDTQGIGLGIYDLGSQFTSPARLQSLLTMNGLHRYPADPDENIGGDTFSTMDVLLHEFGHRWLAYTFIDSEGVSSPTLLGRAYQHWSFFFDADSSLMEGCDWARPAPDSFRTDGVSNGYGALDLYLMGLRSKADTDSFFVVDNANSFDPPGTYIPTTSPFVGLGCRGQAHFYSIDNVETENGARVPDAATAPHAFRIGVVLLTPNGSPATSADLAKLEQIRSRIGPDFAAATHGYGTLDASLDSHAGQVSITHTPLHDTENAGAARPIGARIVIAQGGIPIALDPSSVRAFWRGPGGGAFTSIPLSSAGPDSFAGSLPALPGGGTAEYYLYAASDSAGIEAFDLPAGPAGPHTYVVGTDVTPPVIAHVPVHEQAAVRLPQVVLAKVTDNLGVDSVWVERSIDGGPLASFPASPAGSDSFAVPLGSGVTAGQRIAYRFVARDDAAAHHVTYSNASYDTLVVGNHWLDDFENGDDGFTHQLYWYSYRDAWHLSHEDSSPAGGTSWKCGADGPEAYAPHLDANLITPFINGIGPDTRLWFDHRYDAEQGSSHRAWDGMRLEIQVGAGAWQVLQPVAGYTHVFISNSHPFEKDTPCWSGNSGGWRSEKVDLSPYAPGPVRVRFRMLADDFYGAGGWFVDHIVLGDDSSLVSVPVTPSRFTVGNPWPNPTRGSLALSVSLPAARRAEWALYDVGGRRVALLWKGNIEAGDRKLRADLPALPGGLYFARLTLDGREAGAHRVVVLR